jgi:hypothetical protein
MGGFEAGLERQMGFRWTDVTRVEARGWVNSLSAALEDLFRVGVRLRGK